MTDLPNLTTYDGFLFDLDGVLTPTADLHMAAWQSVFDDVFAEREIAPPYTTEDYFRFVDGKRRYDGVAAVLHSRGIELPWGDPSDGADEDTVCGIGNRKNRAFTETLQSAGIAPYPGSLALLDQLASMPLGVVSSSKNAPDVLRAAGIADRFGTIVDGLVAERDHLPSKPDRAMFARGAAELGIDPARIVAFEDAESGVASASAAGIGLVVGVDRGAGAAALIKHGAHLVVSDLSEFVTGTTQGIS